MTGEQPPSTEDARAEAERRWGDRRTSDRLPKDWLDEGMASGFVLGAEWAASRAMPSDHADVEAIARALAQTTVLTRQDAHTVVEAALALAGLPGIASDARKTFPAVPSDPTATTGDAAVVLDEVVQYLRKVWTPAADYTEAQEVIETVEVLLTQALPRLATVRPDTTTEWGVLYADRSRPIPARGETEARLFAKEYSLPGGLPNSVFRREITDWMEAD